MVEYRYADSISDAKVQATIIKFLSQVASGDLTGIDTNPGLCFALKTNCSAPTFGMGRT